MRIVLIVLAILVLWPVAKRLLAWTVLHVFAKTAGQKAIESQPDHIHLTRVGRQAWADVESEGDISVPLLSRGFEDAGTFTIDEMPGVVLRLLVHREDAMYAAIYEHPKVGQWFELFSRFQDGSSITFSTSRPSGLSPRPGHPVVHAPGITPAELHDRACEERPRRPTNPVSKDKAATCFEESYAEATAWRKEHGISAVEVARVASRSKAA